MVSRVIPVDPFDLVIFGATGDLARRKILPGLFHRFTVGQMPEGARIVGAARSELDADAFERNEKIKLKEKEKDKEGALHSHSNSSSSSSNPNSSKLYSSSSDTLT